MKPIRTEADYREALLEVERLWDSPEGSPEADQLEVLALLIEDYERKHYPIDDPDPIEFLLHVMEARGLTRKDLEPYIGGRGRVSEVLGRKRALSLEMIRALAEELGIPAEVLVKRYSLAA
jgi:HTH-type transcriptional regulator/antitoxin HigA